MKKILFLIMMLMSKPPFEVAFLLSENRFAVIYLLFSLTPRWFNGLMEERLYLTFFFPIFFSSILRPIACICSSEL